jgi:hypothetical protein
MLTALLTDTSKIVVTTSGTVFKPVKVHGPAVRPAQCTRKHYSFMVVNTTSVTQELTFGGQNFAGVGSLHHLRVCLSVGGTYPFGLASNPNATLTVVIG